MDDSRILVFDLECTCWKGRPPAGMRQEIIEIGCSMFNKDTNQITQRRSFIVKPITSDVSAFCTKLTSITQSMVDSEGISLKEACEQILSEYDSQNVISSSWGRTDTKYLKDDCRFAGIKYPLSKIHINLQRRFMLHMGLKHEMSVTNALKHVGMEFDGKQHRPVDDAYNTALLLSHVMSTTSTSVNGSK